MKQFCWGSDTKIVGEMPQIQSEICPTSHYDIVVGDGEAFEDDGDDDMPSAILFH